MYPRIPWNPQSTFWERLVYSV